MLIVSCAQALNRDLPASYVARIETQPIALMGYDDGEDVPGKETRRPDRKSRRTEVRPIPEQGASGSFQLALLGPTTIPLAKT